MQKLHIALASCAAVIAAGTAATALPLYGTAAVGTAGTEGGGHALVLGGVATIVHQDGDGNVLGEQSVHNLLLNEGEDFILQQVFMDSQSAVDSAQIGAICLSSAPDSTIAEGLSASDFNTNHNNNAEIPNTGASTIAAADTHECLTDTSVGSSGQIATVGPLVFTANNTATQGSESNWKPDVPIRIIGICQGFSAANGEDACTAPLFAAVNITDVTLGIDETLTVTYTFDMTSDGT